MSLVYQNQTARELYYGSQKILRAYAGSRKVFDRFRGHLWKNCFAGDYYIFEGKLYSGGGTQITEFDDWIDVGLRNGGLLYEVSETTATRKGSDTGWTAIRGGAAMRNGKLYQVSNLSQIGGNYDDFAELCNEYYAIRNGQVCSAQDGTAISGLPSGNWIVSLMSIGRLYRTLGIIDGTLYDLDGNSVIDSTKTWTSIGGVWGTYYYFTAYSIAVGDGQLFGVYRSGSSSKIAQLDTNTGWGKVSGSFVHSSSSDYAAFALRDGELYSVTGTPNDATVTRIGTESDWRDVCGMYDPSNTQFGAYAVKSNGALYKLTDSAATLIG